MKTSLIQHRVADFLKQYPPCCYMEAPNLLALAGSGRVSFHESGEFIFREGQERRPFIWVIQQGHVELLGPHLVDLLGLGRFLGHPAHRHSARTASDVILYALDAIIFERMVHEYPQASAYLGAHFSLHAPFREEKTSWIDQASPPAHLLACPPETPIREAARILSRHHADAIAVIGAAGKPLGLITTRQLSDRVATGDLSIDARCDALMQPVVTARADISLGAVAVLQAEIHLADAFETLLTVAYNSASVTVHGITRDQARDGLGEPEALEQFIAYLKDGVIVGHHIGHDIALLNAACGRHFGFALRNRWIDTMDLALHLERDGAFAGSAEIKSFSLDALCQRFGVIPHDRHTAGGDAFLTAQVFLKLLRLARRSGRNTLASLAERCVPDER